MTTKSTVAEPCPCESGQPYSECCGPLHQGLTAATPETLMRSRYSAYVLKLKLYLLTTWHPSTRPRPETLELDEPGLKWLGLKVQRAEAADADNAIVEFVARYRVGGGKAVRMHEVSRFVREQGRWFYLDSVVRDA